MCAVSVFRGQRCGCPHLALHLILQPRMHCLILQVTTQYLRRLDHTTLAVHGDCSCDLSLATDATSCQYQIKCSTTVSESAFFFPFFIVSVTCFCFVFLLCCCVTVFRGARSLNRLCPGLPGFPVSVFFVHFALCFCRLFLRLFVYVIFLRLLRSTLHCFALSPVSCFALHCIALR